MKRFAKGDSVPGSIRLAAQCLTRIGKAIHKIGEEKVKLHHHRIHRENNGSAPGTSRGEIKVDRDQTERAEEDIAIDTEEFTEMAKKTVLTEILEQSAIIMEKEA